MRRPARTRAGGVDGRAKVDGVVGDVSSCVRRDATPRRGDVVGGVIEDGPTLEPAPVPVPPRTASDDAAGASVPNAATDALGAVESSLTRATAVPVAVPGTSSGAIETWPYPAASTGALPMGAATAAVADPVGVAAAAVAVPIGTPAAAVVVPVGSPAVAVADPVGAAVAAVPVPVGTPATAAAAAVLPP